MAFQGITADTDNRNHLQSLFQYGDTPTEANYKELIKLLATVTELEREEATRISVVTAETTAREAGDQSVRDDLTALISTNDDELAALQAADDKFDTLLGLAALAVDLGTFQGTTIDDGKSVKVALQQLVDAHEGHGTRLTTAETEIDALQYFSTQTQQTLGIEIAQTNTEIAAHDTRLATLESTTILDSFIFACSSNIGNIATGDVSTFRMPYGFTCTEVRASLITNTASSAVSLKVFVDGTAITDQVDIAAGATTTYQVGVASTFLLGQNSSPQPIAMDSEVKVNVTAAPTGATGLKVTLVGYVGTCAINVAGGSITFPITFPLGTVNTLITCTG